MFSKPIGIPAGIHAPLDFGFSLEYLGLSFSDL